MSTSSITGTPATSAAGDGTRRSLRNARRLLLRALHSLSVVTTTSNGAADGTTFLSTQLRTATSTDRYKHSWVIPVSGASAAELRRVQIEDALNLTTGALTVAPPFSGQLVSGVEVEITRLLPPVDDDGWVGARTCINRALSEMWTPQRLTITGVNGQPSYSLSTYEDWLDPDAVRELYGPALNTTLNPYARGGFVPVRSGDSLTLQVYPTLAAGDAAELEVYRPSDTFLKVGGVWGTSTTGMVNDTDEHLHHPEVVVIVALAYAYEALANGPDGARYQALAVTQRRKANVMKLGHLDHRQSGTHSRRMPAGYGWDPKNYADWGPSNMGGW